MLKAMRTVRILRGQEGFSMVELLIVMTLFVLVLAITLNTSSIIFKQSSQQAKVSEAQMESIVGLEMLRVDLEQAGYGLPWSFQDTISYNEASSSPASTYNDAPSGVPRAIAGGYNLSSYVLNNSDYLVIKSTISGMDSASQKMSYMFDSSTASAEDGLSPTDNVIIIRPQVSDTVLRQLVMNGSNFYTTFVMSGDDVGSRELSLQVPQFDVGWSSFVLKQALEPEE